MVIRILFCVLFFASVARASEFTNWLVATTNINPCPEVHKSMTELHSQEASCDYKEPLSDDERCSIELYEITGLYRTVNSALRNDMTQTIAENRLFIDTLTSALAKLPAKSGTIYRYIYLTPDEISSYVVGQKVLQKSFTSTSASENWKVKGKSFGNVFLKIQTRNGHDIYCYSRMKEEKEWLLNRNALFSIDKIVKTADGAEIDVTDLTPPMK